MASGRDLRKWARQFFTPEMASRGFALVMGSRFEYVREVNGVHHFIAAHQKQYIPTMWVHIYMKGDQATPGWRVGGRLNLKDVGIGGEIWPIANEDEAQKSFPSVLRLIDQCALPYFAKIKDLSDFNLVEQYLDQHGGAGTSNAIDAVLRSR
jgi:hypothetical protein